MQSFTKFQCYMWYIWHSACAQIYDFFLSKCNKKHHFPFVSCSLFNFKFIWFRNFILKFSRAKNCILHNLIKKWYDFFMLTIALISGIFFNFKFIVNQCVFLPVFRHAIHLPVRISFTLNKMIFFYKCYLQYSVSISNIIESDSFWLFLVICRTNH